MSSVHFLLLIYLNIEQHGVGFLSFILNVICSELFSWAQLLSPLFVYLTLHTLLLFMKLVIMWYYVLRVNVNIRLAILFCDRNIRIFSSPSYSPSKKKMPHSMNNLSAWILQDVFEDFMVQASLFYVSFLEAGEVPGITIWTQSVTSSPGAVRWWVSQAQKI